VPEGELHRLHRRARLDQRRGKEVAEAVQPGPGRQPDRARRGRPDLRPPPRLDQLAALGGEQQPRRALRHLPRVGRVLELDQLGGEPLQVLRQRQLHGVEQLDGAPRGLGLRRRQPRPGPFPVARPGAAHGELLGHVQLAAQEVDPWHFEAEQLAGAQPAPGREVHRGAVALRQGIGERVDLRRGRDEVLRPVNLGQANVRAGRRADDPVEHRAAEHRDQGAAVGDVQRVRRHHRRAVLHPRLEVA